MGKRRRKVKKVDWLTLVFLWPWANTSLSLSHSFLLGEVLIILEVSILQGCCNRMLFVKMFWILWSATQLHYFITVSQQCWNTFKHCWSSHLIIHSRFTEQVLTEFQKLWFMLALKSQTILPPSQVKKEKKNERGKWEKRRAGKAVVSRYHWLFLCIG